MSGNKKSGNRLVGSNVYDFNRLIVKCADYLLKNFHKFTTTQKIDIAKSVIGRAMPAPEGSGNNQTVIITIQKPSADNDTDVVIHRDRAQMAEDSPA